MNLLTKENIYNVPLVGNDVWCSRGFRLGATSVT